MTGEEAMKRLTRWFPLLLIAAAVLAYANSFQGEFLFDDATVITANPRIHRLWPPWACVVTATRWVAYVTFSINYAIGKWTVSDYRAVNILIHTLAALFLYGIARRLLLVRAASDAERARAPWLALAIGLLWVTHPLQTQAVTYIAQREESLMGLFFLAAVYAFVRGLKGDRPRLWFDVAIAIAMVGMGTKEVMVTLPVVLWLLDWTFSGDSFWEILRKRGLVHVALALTWGVMAVLVLITAGTHWSGYQATVTSYSPLVYARTQLGVIGHYLRLVYVPHPLCLDYFWPAAESWRDVAGSGALIAVLLVSSLVALRRRSAYGFLGAAFFVILAPTSSIMPIPDVVFEHRMYLPLACVLAATVMAVHYALEKTAGRRAGVIGMALCLTATAGLGAMTARRNRDYRSADIMWADVLAKQPHNPRAYIGCSSGLLGQRRYSEAAVVARMLLKRLPPFERMSREELVAWLSDRHRAKAFFYCGHARNNLGLAWHGLGRHEDAIREYQTWLRLEPYDVKTRHNMAWLYYAQGRQQEALREWRRILSLNPEHGPAHAMVGIILLQRGDAASAKLHLERAVDILPDAPAILCELAWLLATAPDSRLRDGARAVRLAEAASKAAGDGSVRALDVLAAAYAEMGQFEEAELCAQRALALAEEHEARKSEDAEAGRAIMTERKEGMEALAPAERTSFSSDHIRARLEMYRHRQPVRIGPAPTSEDTP